MSGKSSQKKGRGGELELTRILNSNGINAEPGQALNYGTVPDITGVDGIHAEVKRVERLNVLEAMTQAVTDSERFKDGLPTLFHRRNRSPWLVTMRLNDWLSLYKDWRTK